MYSLTDEILLRSVPPLLGVMAGFALGIWGSRLNDKRRIKMEAIVAITREQAHLAESPQNMDLVVRWHQESLVRLYPQIALLKLYTGKGYAGIEAAWRDYQLKECRGDQSQFVGRGIGADRIHALLNRVIEEVQRA